MPLNANQGERPDPTPEAVYVGTCYAIYDLGTQHSAYYDKDSHKVLICWELDGPRIEIDGEDKPRGALKRYTLSLNSKANLRKDLEAWRGRKFTQEQLDGFDLKKLLGASCQLQIVHNVSDGVIYENVAAIMALPKGMEGKPLENETKFFSFEDGEEPGEEIPDGIRKIIMDTPEYAAMHGVSEHVPLVEDLGDCADDDEAPF